MSDTITDITYDRSQVSYTRLCGHDYLANASARSETYSKKYNVVSLCGFFYNDIWSKKKKKKKDQLYQ